MGDDDLLLLLRGGGLAGEGDLQDPAYRRRLQDGARELQEIDALVSSDWPYESDPLRDVMTAADEQELRSVQEAWVSRHGATPEVLLEQARRQGILW